MNFIVVELIVEIINVPIGHLDRLDVGPQDIPHSLLGITIPTPGAERRHYDVEPSTGCRSRAEQVAGQSPSPQAVPAGEYDHVLPATTNCALGGGDGHSVLHYVEAVLQQRTAAEVQNGRETVQKPSNRLERGFPPPAGVCLAEGQDLFKLAIISRSWGGAPSIGQNPTGGCHDADQGIRPLNFSHGLLEGGVHVQQGVQDAVQPVATVHGLNEMPGRPGPGPGLPPARSQLSEPVRRA